MKTIKVLVLIILSIISLVICLVLLINIIEYRSNVANRITGDQIKKIEMGMKFEDVISILGKPYKIDADGDHHNLNCENPKHGLAMDVEEDTDIKKIVDNYFNDTVYCCEGNREAKQRFGKNVSLTYTKPVFLSKYYPMLWVHFDSNYCVRNVFAKRYEFMYDDICIYSLSWEIDETTLEEIPGKISFFINNELFEKSFNESIH